LIHSKSGHCSRQVKVLGSLKADAEAFFGHPVTRAVITVPAYFNHRQRKSTIAAGRIAGLTGTTAADTRCCRACCFHGIAAYLPGSLPSR